MAKRLFVSICPGILALSLTAIPVMAQQPTDIVIQSSVNPGASTTVTMFGLHGAPAQVTGAPYSAEAVTETSQVRPDGTRNVNRSAAKLYRDSAGRQRREEGSMVTISDPAANVTWELHANTKTALRMPVISPGGPMLAARLSAGAPPVSVPPQNGSAGGPVLIQSVDAVPARRVQAIAMVPVDLGVAMVEGALAHGTRTNTIMNVDGQPSEIAEERWVSPELQMTVMWKQTDSRGEETIYRLTNLDRTEPAASLFQVPPDYTVRDLTLQPAGCGGCIH